MTCTNDQKLVCPECGSDQVTTEHHQMFMVNTGEHYCHSMKTHDAESPAACLECLWAGQRHQLKHTHDLHQRLQPRPRVRVQAISARLCAGRHQSAPSSVWPGS